jgi:hypothetical protein
MGYAADLIDLSDEFKVEAFRNFMSWELKPGHIVGGPLPACVWAYMLGYTQWCPPKGTL